MKKIVFIILIIAALLVAIYKWIMSSDDNEETVQETTEEVKEPATSEKETVKPETAKLEKVVHEQMTLFDDKLLSEKSKKRHQFIGQVFETYWLVQMDDTLYIIDQHAAHEKVLYERIVKEMKEHQRGFYLLL